MTEKVKKRTAKKQAAKVDFEPTKMSLAVAALASISLVLLALLATYS